MPSLIEELVQGLEAGKARKRQSLLDQLEQQYKKAQMDMEKASLAQREKEFKFNVLQQQHQDIKENLGMQGLMESLRSSTQFYQRPEETIQSLQQAPVSIIDKLRGVLEGQPQYAPGTQPVVQPIPGWGQQKQYLQQKQAGELQEQQANIELKKSQAQAQRSLALSRQSKITDATKLGFKGSDAVRLVNDFNSAYMAAVKNNMDASMLGEPTIELPIWEEYLDTAYKALNYGGKAERPTELPSHTPGKATGNLSEQQVIEGFKAKGMKEQDVDFEAVRKQYPYLNLTVIKKALET